MLGERFSRCACRTARSSLAARRSGADSQQDLLHRARSPASMSSSPMSRCVTARSQPGTQVADADAALGEPLLRPARRGSGRSSSRRFGVEADAVGEPRHARGRRRAARRGGRARRASQRRAMPDCRIAPPKRNFPSHARSISLGRAGEDGAERAAEPLREADRDGVGERCPGGAARRRPRRKR